MVKVEISNNSFELSRRPHNVIHDVFVVFLFQVLKGGLESDGFVLDHDFNVHVIQQGLICIETIQELHLQNFVKLHITVYFPLSAILLLLALASKFDQRLNLVQFLNP
jgi:hypothetical protein